MSLTKIYSVLTGEDFDKIIEKFDTNLISHFAKVSIGNKEFDFALFSQDLFGTKSYSYIFVNEEDKLVYSNLDDEEVVIAYMYTILLKNLDKIENPSELFEDREILDRVKTLQRRMVLSNSVNVSIKYLDDYQIITDNPKLNFTSYLLDYKKLNTLFSFEFEQRHLQLFNRMKPLKDSFKEFKVQDTETIDELEKEGIYLETIQYTSFMDSLDNKENILLTGPTGAGKTKIMFHLLRKRNLEYLTFECNEAKTYSDAFGSITLDKDKNLVASWGKFTIAYRDGHPLVLEEFTALNDRVFKALLTMLTHDELTLELDTEVDGEFQKNITIKRHPDFFVIATANEEKRYNVKGLTPQVKRRFETILPINYLPHDKEVKLVIQRIDNKGLPVNQEQVEQIVNIGNRLRDKKLVVSTATIAIWAEKSIRYGMRDASVCHFIPQVCFSKNDLKAVNDILSTEIPNYEYVDIAL